MTSGLRPKQIVRHVNFYQVEVLTVTSDCKLTLEKAASSPAWGTPPLVMRQQWGVWNLLLEVIFYSPTSSRWSRPQWNETIPHLDLNLESAAGPQCITVMCEVRGAVTALVSAAVVITYSKSLSLLMDKGRNKHFPRPASSWKTKDAAQQIPTF